MMQGRETSPDMEDKEEAGWQKAEKVAGERDVPTISEEQTLNS